MIHLHRSLTCSPLQTVSKKLANTDQRSEDAADCRGAYFLLTNMSAAIKSWASELEALKSLWQKYPNDEDVFPTIITANLSKLAQWGGLKGMQRQSLSASGSCLTESIVPDECKTNVSACYGPISPRAIGTSYWYSDRCIICKWCTPELRMARPPFASPTSKGRRLSQSRGCMPA